MRVVITEVITNSVISNINSQGNLKGLERKAPRFFSRRDLPLGIKHFCISNIDRFEKKILPIQLY